MKPLHKGMCLSFGTALGSAAFLMPFKRAGALADRDVVILAILFVAALLNTAVTLRSINRKTVFDRVSITAAAVLGVLTVSGNYAAGEALQHLGAGVTSVLQQTQILFVTLGSWVFLRERVTRRFLAGTAVVLAGLLIMRAPSSTSAGAVDLALPGLARGITSALSFAIMHVFTRQVIHRIQPVWVNALRLWFAVAILLSVPGNAAGAAAMDGQLWLLCLVAGFIGPFLARISLMYSLRHITASHSTLILLAAPVLAFLLDYAIFGRAPTTFELIGGAVALAGISIPILEMMSAGGGARPKIST